jgi:hypothetical protein
MRTHTRARAWPVAAAAGAQLCGGAAFLTDGPQSHEITQRRLHGSFYLAAALSSRPRGCCSYEGVLDAVVGCVASDRRCVALHCSRLSPQLHQPFRGFHKNENSIRSMLLIY